ncbi:hypothetical protein BDF21DRAFT_112973 [Thamnidium elegans]|nr:hypothetical protein BDF21DRAFT_112973 [Thamnidium elegans]
MATEAEKNVAENSIQRDENEIAHNYFEHTAIKDWKVVGALAYYIKQNVPLQEAYAMVEIALQNAIKSRKSSANRGQAILDELNTLKAISQGGSVPSASSSSVKVADQINNFGSITQTNNITQPKKRKTGAKDGQVLVKKTKKAFTFYKPLTGHLITINKPRVTKEDASQVAPAFEVIISDTPSTPTSSIIRNKYNENMEDQRKNKCLNSLPKVYDLINKVINGKYDNMLDTVDSYKFDPTHSENDKKAIKLFKYIINDYHANCEKPVYYTDANERTPYCEYIIPIFKYFSAVYKNLSFMW